MIKCKSVRCKEEVQDLNMYCKGCKKSIDYMRDFKTREFCPTPKNKELEL